MRILFQLLAMTVALTDGASASAATSARTADFVLTAKGGKVVDRSGRIPAEKIKAENVEIVSDPRYGEVMRLGSTGFSMITVADEGKISMKEGLTVDAMVYLEHPVTNNLTLAAKTNKEWDLCPFELQLASGSRFTVAHVSTGNEPIDFTKDELPYTWALEPYRHYPGRHGAANGNLPIATGEWTRVTFTYDAKTHAIRTWVNGILDREGFDDYLCRGHELFDSDADPVTLFRGMHGVRVAALSMSPYAKDPGKLPPVRVYVHESPYVQGYVHLRTLADDLPYPVQVEVINIGAGISCETRRGTLTGPGEINVDIPPFDWGSCKSDLIVILKKGNRELYRYETLVMNPSLVSTGMVKFYQGTGDWAPTNPDWKIDGDLTMRYKNRRIFPLMLYFANPKDWDLLTEIGFNGIHFKQPKGTNLLEHVEMLKPCYAKAAALGITICSGYEYDDDLPAQGIRLGQDEPYAITWKVNRDGYMEARNGRAHTSLLPFYATQNNWHRYRETATVCDILAPDPYARGRHPSRFIYDSMVAATHASDGRKTVFCVMGNYGTDPWRPNAEEFRTQCYMAIIGGARGLAFYSWDEGDEPGGPTDTTEKPEQIAAYRTIFSEFKTLNDALTAPNAEAVATVPAEPRGIFAALKHGRDGKDYLFVASDLFRTTQRTLSCPALKGRTADLLFGGTRTGGTQKLTFSSAGEAEITMPPVSAAVFRLGN